jgi:hypothetical protein
MFLSKESFEEINKNFIPSSPLNIIDKDGILKNMESLYELEDYIKENIYDKKYPGILPNIETNLYSQEEDNYSDDEEEEREEKSIEKNSQNESNKKEEKKYKIIPKPNDIITFNENFSTDDEDEYDAIQLLNEDRSEGNENGWVLCINKDDKKIYYKVVKLQDEKGNDVDSLIFYADATIDFPSKTLNKYVNDFNFRKEFDMLYSQGKILEEKTEGENLKIFELYLYMKMPFVFTDRDFVVRKKIWSNHNNKKDCTLIHIKSIENSEYPPKDKPVRGLFINRGAYICPTDNGQSKLYLSTCFDMKMNVSPSMMKQKGSEGQGQWVHKFIENIKKHEN